MQKTTNLNLKTLPQIFPYLLAVLFLANATALFSDILGPDATLYAFIAKRISTTNDFVNLFGNGYDWLDKPHLPFWLAAISFKIFGVNAFAYKLPNFLAYILANYYVYAIGNTYFNKNIAQLSCLIFASSLHIILCNFDVRAEIFLTTFIIASTFYILKSITEDKISQIFLAAFFAAMAVITKGIFVLITIGAGFVLHWIFTKQWKEFVKPKWYLFVLLTFIFIIPELYCLYMQFDMHPEKIIFGKQNVSGLKFFFWDSQFGRFFNNGPITGESEKLFFVHTTLWAYIPWCIALVLGVFYVSKKFIQQKFAVNNPFLFITNSTALVTFVIFNLSKFQLPHYIVIIFPHLSLLTGYYLANNLKTSVYKIINVSLLLILGIIICLFSIICYLLELKGWQAIPLIGLLLTTIFILYFKQIQPVFLVLKGVSIMCFFAVFLNIIYFPCLMAYQGGMMAGKFQQKEFPTTVAYMYKCNDYNFEFYGNCDLKRIEHPKTICTEIKKPILLFGLNSNFTNINKDSFSLQKIKTFADFHISEIKLDFIIPKTRASVLDSFSLAYCTRIK